jgi:signal transduction histidine kinase
MKKSSQFLQSTINDILDYAQIKSMKFRLRKQIFSLNEFTADLTFLFQFILIQRNLKLSIINKSSQNYIYNDSDRLKRILVNLISNSVKFTQTGGITVTILDV